MPIIVDMNANQTIFEYLKDNKIQYIKSFNIENLYEPVNTHPDMQIHFLNENTAVSSPECFEYYRKKLPVNISLIKGKTYLSGTYPFDIAYNVARIGDYVFCNVKNTDKCIIEYYKSNGFNIIDVKQGYTKCNICNVTDNSIITEDTGIANAAQKVGFDICLLESKTVKLKNFTHGFIGGATGIVGKDSLAIYGNIKAHPESDKIIKFLENHSVKAICLYNGNITDYGSLIEF